MEIASDVQNSFDAHSFPATTEELIEEYGEMVMDLPHGEVTLGEVLNRLPNEELDSAEEACLSTYSAFSEEAIGRKGYSDRDPRCPGEAGHDQVSL